MSLNKIALHRKVGQRVFHTSIDGHLTEGIIHIITDTYMGIVWQASMSVRQYYYDISPFWDQIVFCCETP